MKQLTDAERLEVAMGILDERQVNEYAERCRELEQNCERNGFHNTPAECEPFDCCQCPFGDRGKEQLSCPYVDVT
jgi:hypothetical protein